MTQNIKPIETVYNGYRFRSRLEARWAVFFDTLGIEYQYEPEGFDLGEGRFYLPDFWLPQVNMWAEVKPETFTLRELGNLWRLAEQSGHSCLMLVGAPDNKPYCAWAWNGNDMTLLGYCLTMFHGYPVDEHRFYSFNGDSDGEFNDVALAALAARQARFEHGERGMR